MPREVPSTHPHSGGQQSCVATSTMEGLLIGWLDLCMDSMQVAAAMCYKPLQDISLGQRICMQLQAYHFSPVHPHKCRAVQAEMMQSPQSSSAGRGVVVYRLRRWLH